MFDCWKKPKRRRHGVTADLWQLSEAAARLHDVSIATGAGDDTGDSPEDILKMEQQSRKQLKALVSAFSEQCLVHDQLKMLSRVTEAATADVPVEDVGACLLLPHEVYLSKVHSTVCPLTLLAQLLRWPDLTSTKDLYRLTYLCRDAAGSPLSSSSSGRGSSSPEVTHHKNTQLDRGECCNPFHWARQLQEPSTVMPQQKQTEKQLLSAMYPPDYHSVDTESVKDESDRCSSTETGISRICGGQISAGTTTAHENDLCSDYPGAKQYCLPRQQYHTRPRSHHWSMLRYWEESTPLGSGPFKVRDAIFNVSYGTVRRPANSGHSSHSGHEGMNLEVIENSSRTKRTVALRERIGLGFTLILDEEAGVVKLYNRSKLALFVASRYLDAHHGGEEEMAGMTSQPVKVQPGWCVDAHDLDWSLPVSRPAGVHGSSSYTGTSVVPLAARFDSICVSFGKGWGPGYQRSSVMQCSCWMEISLDNIQQR